MVSTNPIQLEYFTGSLFEAVSNICQQYPKGIAFDFMGSSCTYAMLIKQAEACARAFIACGLKPGDRVTLALPNCPQALYLFYGINLAGGIANMIHPLSAEQEIAFYLKDSQSTMAITLDQFYPKFKAVLPETGVHTLIVTSIKDALHFPMTLGYAMTQGRKIAKVPKGDGILDWNAFLKKGTPAQTEFPVVKADNPAVILYSGGTTGTTKGIVLTNLNFNALSQQVIAANPMFEPGDRMLAAMPIFHGFGLGVCIHTMLTQGGRCVLVPRFTPKSYAKLIGKYRCNFIAGVPTLFEALLRLPGLDSLDMSSLKGVFSGGDSLSVELKKKLDRFLFEHGATIQVREGYGTTETVTACCLTPWDRYKEGSIGLPFPDTYMKIVELGTDRELAPGEEGEILLAGPTVMREYWGQPEETARTLRRHEDGHTWVYTGDLGVMDDEGFIYFRGRAKRMIVSSGYNIYPAQLENLLDAHPFVQMSCIIGVPDPYKMQKVKAFVKLSALASPTEETKSHLMEYCRKHIAKYALPYDIEFREDLPKTLVGKVAYRILEEEELRRSM